MAKRGKYKQGYYIAVLYALELSYEFQQKQGLDIKSWQPLASKRPGQFLAFVVDCLKHLKPSLDNYQILLDLLNQYQLSYVARALDFVIRKKLTGQQVDIKELPQKSIDELQRILGYNQQSAELHPQVRKYVSSLQTDLDARWKALLITLEADYSNSVRWPQVSLLLGSLPPSFAILLEQFQSGFKQLQGKVDWRDISVMQFYGLMTGSLPVPDHWESFIQELIQLTPHELAELRQLTAVQLDQLARLDHEGFMLLLLSRSLRRGQGYQQKLIAALIQLHDEEEGNDNVYLLEAFSKNYGVTIMNLSKLLQMGSKTAWQQIYNLDEGLVQKIDQGSLTFSVYQQFKAVNLSSLQALRGQLQEDWEWLSAYLDDYQTVETLKSYRAPIYFDLIDLFPETIAWLNKQSSMHIKDILLRDFSTVLDFALDFSAIIRQRLNRTQNKQKLSSTSNLDYHLPERQPSNKD